MSSASKKCNKNCSYCHVYILIYRNRNTALNDVYTWSYTMPIISSTYIFILVNSRIFYVIYKIYILFVYL